MPVYRIKLIILNEINFIFNAWGELLEKIVPYSDSLGMNEQELPNLHSLLTTGIISAD